MNSMQWPSLPYEAWKDTLDTLHMWTQIVGKIKLKLAPFLNHWWEVAFQVTARELTTGLIPYNGEVFQVDFNFADHQLIVTTSRGKQATMDLKPMSVAVFYRVFMDVLADLGIRVTIWLMPVETNSTIPFDMDTMHYAYDKLYVGYWREALIHSAVVFEHFRSAFRGKSSPVQFYWGSFDLSSTRFSGEKAAPPELTGTIGKIMRHSENEENFAFGFWPGDERYPQAAYYTYMYPKPKGMEAVELTQGALFHAQLSECLMPYETVRHSNHPDQVLLGFLEAAYNGSAMLAGWDLPSLRAEMPGKQ